MASNRMQRSKRLGFQEAFVWIYNSLQILRENRRPLREIVPTLRDEQFLACNAVWLFIRDPKKFTPEEQETLAFNSWHCILSWWLRLMEHSTSELPPPLPIGGSIIVGHNFDSEAGFQRSYHHAGESLKSATWRNLLAFLEQVGISPEQCFFTNAYVGLKAGAALWAHFPAHEITISCAGVGTSSSSSSGSSNHGSSSRWVSMCLGSWPPFPELQIAWSDATRFRTLDERGVALVYPSTFSGVLRPAVVVALTHPAYRKLNVTSRRYGNLQGDAAEQALVRDALMRVGNGETTERLAVSV